MILPHAQYEIISRASGPGRVFASGASESGSRHPDDHPDQGACSQKFRYHFTGNRI